MSPGAGALSRGRLGLLFLALAALASLTATGALADTKSVRDNRNTRANLFDIRSAIANHRGELLNHTIETYRAWRSRELRSTRRRPRIMCVYIWRARSDARLEPDFQICAKLSRGKLRGYVFDVRSRRKTKDEVRIRRLDLESLTYSFRPSAIGDPSWYGWQAVTGYTGKRCARQRAFRYGCDDSAPTGCALPHELTPGSLPVPAPSCPRTSGSG
jgi:hypothetical protein